MTELTWDARRPDPPSFTNSWRRMLKGTEVIGVLYRFEKCWHFALAVEWLRVATHLNYVEWTDISEDAAEQFCIQIVLDGIAADAAKRLGDTEV